MAYTLGQAAKAVGVTRAAIWQAINSNRIRAEKDEKNRWQIDAEELFRIYPPKHQAKQEEIDRNLHNENKGFEDRLNALEELYRKLIESKDDHITALEKQLDYLREHNSRILGVLAAEKQLQLQKWERAQPTVIEVPPSKGEGAGAAAGSPKAGPSADTATAQQQESSPPKQRWWMRLFVKSAA